MKEKFVNSLDGFLVERLELLIENKKWEMNDDSLDLLNGWVDVNNNYNNSNSNRIIHIIVVITIITIMDVPYLSFLLTAIPSVNIHKNYQPGFPHSNSLVLQLPFQLYTMHEFTIIYLYE